MPRPRLTLPRPVAPCHAPPSPRLALPRPAQPCLTRPSFAPPDPAQPRLVLALPCFATPSPAKPDRAQPSSQTPALASALSSSSLSFSRVSHNDGWRSGGGNSLCSQASRSCRADKR